MVDASGGPVPLGPEAPRVAARRGEGETAEEHDRAEHGAATTAGGRATSCPSSRPSRSSSAPASAGRSPRSTRELRSLAGPGRRRRRRRRGPGRRRWPPRRSPSSRSPTEGERYERMLDAFGTHRRGDAHLRLPRPRRASRTTRRASPSSTGSGSGCPCSTALTANSPFWQGADTGYASYRSQAWRRWPSAGPNELFADAADYHRLIDAVLATDTVLDTGMLYFDARLSEKWPTVEVRTADVALRGRGRRHPRRPRPRPRRDRRPVGPGRAAGRRTCAPRCCGLAAWRAGRSGLTGDLVHPAHRPARRRPPTSSTDLLDHVRAALADAGDEQRVDRRRRGACCAAAPVPTCSAACTGRPAATWPPSSARRWRSTAGRTGARPAGRPPAAAG